ncbi:diguanylate cyclase domain-containing protein [Methylocaldum sp.]|uniref:diguanylate cyclase domain-containing protein n=1 Tax=Methylocaldum sp. TaxID=1969727 RepID=UPI002D4803F9|nr:transporter substrate-binding domain-containing protein [Methylocaldum sp.]HYE33995.1 transporter substrate-binding domain-containing protein [Methylocaldum sp.]
MHGWRLQCTTQLDRNPIVLVLAKLKVRLRKKAAERTDDALLLQRNWMPFTPMSPQPQAAVRPPVSVGPIRLLTCLALLGLQPIRAAEPIAAENRVWVMGSDRDYTPYQFLDAAGQPVGFDVDITRAAAEVMGLKIVIRTDEWETLRQDLENQRLDGVVGMFYSSDRTRNVDFTSPYLQLHHRLFVPRGSAIRNLEDVAAARLVVQNGDLMHDQWRAKGGSVTAVPTLSKALFGLDAGRFDAALIPHLQGVYLIRQKHIANVIAIGTPLFPTQKCIALAKGHPELLGQLNEGLTIIKASGRYDALYNHWFGITSPSAADEKLRSYLAWGAALLASLMLLGLSGVIHFRQRTRRLSQEIERQRNRALHDSLTGLGNRLLLLEHFEQARAAARRHHQQIALLLIDLDGFKEVNDRLGHPAGDQILCTVAHGLRRSVRDMDTVVRNGGDEFIILLKELSNEHPATVVAEKILQHLDSLPGPDLDDIPLGASIGIALYPTHGEELELLIRKADRAMYHCKANGKNRYGFCPGEAV